MSMPTSSPSSSSCSSSGMSIATDTANVLTAEDKRERQRQHAKRSYYKRAKAMNALKVERDVLEKQYKEALAKHSDLLIPIDSTEPLLPSLALQKSERATLAAGPTHPSEMVDQIMELSHVRDSLRQENAELKQAVGRFFTFQRRLQQSVEDMDSESDPDADTMLAATSPDNDAMLSELLAHQFDRMVLTRPMTVAECTELNLKAYGEMVAFLKRGGGYGTAGANLHGWQEYRSSHNGRFRFSTRKLFQMRAPIELSNKTWEILSSPTKFPQLYSSNISMQVDLVHQVDDDNVLFYRTLQIPNSTKVAKSLFLVSRFHTDSGYMILLQSFDRTRCQPVLSPPHPSAATRSDQEEQPKDDSIWMDLFTWVVFSEVGEKQEHCQLEFGGFVVDATPEVADFWMLEVLLISLRWESKVVGPVFKAI